MKGEKLYELLDLLDDNLVMESAEVKRGVWRRRLAIVAAIVAAAVLVWFVTTEPVRHPRQDVGGAGRIGDSGPGRLSLGKRCWCKTSAAPYA